MPFKDFTIEPLTSADVDTYLMSQVIIRCTSGSRPSSPAEGWHIYETDTQRFMVYKSGSWRSAGGRSRAVVKPSDESISSTTSAQNDDHLLLSVTANTNYSVDLFLIYTSSSTAIAYDFTVPTGATLQWHPSKDSTGTIRQNPGDWWSAASTGGRDVVYIRGILKVGVTAGNLQFRWWQSVASGTSIVRADSTLKLEELAA